MIINYLGSPSHQKSALQQPPWASSKKNTERTPISSTLVILNAVIILQNHKDTLVYTPRWLASVLKQFNIKYESISNLPSLDLNFEILENHWIVTLPKDVKKNNAILENTQHVYIHGILIWETAILFNLPYDSSRIRKFQIYNVKKETRYINNITNSIVTNKIYIRLIFSGSTACLKTCLYIVHNTCIKIYPIIAVMQWKFRSSHAVLYIYMF